MSVAVIIPTYGQWLYVEHTIASLRATCSEAVVVVVDDGSPDWPGPRRLMDWGADKVQRYDNHARNLSRSWNAGLRWSRALGVDYTVCANSDLVFAPGWWPALQATLSQFGLAGPLTNAPGHCATQQVQKYIDNNIVIESSADSLMGVAITLSQLAAVSGSSKRVPRINGFCMAARTETWWQYSHDAGHVFDPAIPMEGNEDTWQKQAHRHGLRAGVALGAMVYHYRGVSRGLTGPSGGWSRLPGRQARCEHLGPIIARTSTCWKKWEHACNLGGTTQHAGRCQSCPKYEAD